MTLPIQTPAQLLQNMVTAFAGETGIEPVFTSGDATLAFWQSVVVNLDFLQGLIQTVVSLTRAQTSNGPDLDSWMAQFGFVRLGATFADGPETFTSNQPAVTQVLIPAGALIQTGNGGIQYQVVGSSSEPTWNAGLNAYVLAVGQTTLTAVVQAVVAGSASNVSANTLGQIASPLTGIDVVTNPDAITNGVDAESDNAFRARFVLYLGTLAEATEAAILAAAESVQQGLQITLIENQNTMGDTIMGSFAVFVDDGSGDPPDQLITNVYNAVFAVRAFSVQPFVAGPNVLAVTISLNIRLASGALIGTVGPLVKAAIVAATNVLLTGATLFVSTVEGAALTAAGVAAIEPGLTLLNGSNADLMPASNQEIRTATGSITVGTY